MARRGAVLEVSLPAILRTEGVLAGLIGRTLHEVGTRTRNHSYSNVFKNKPAIKYKTRQDKKGRSLVRYRVTKRRGNLRLLIFSYPLNLYERGRRLRSGKRSKPLRVFSRIIKPIAERYLANEKTKLEKKFLV